MFISSLLFAFAVHGLLLYWLIIEGWMIWERDRAVKNLKPRSGPLLEIILRRPQPTSPAAAGKQAKHQQNMWQKTRRKEQQPAARPSAADAAPPPLESHPSTDTELLRQRLFQVIRSSPWSPPPDHSVQNATLGGTPVPPPAASWMTPLLPTTTPKSGDWCAADGNLQKVVTLASGERYCSQSQARNLLGPFNVLPMLWRDCGNARGRPPATFDPWQRLSPGPQ